MKGPGFKPIVQIGTSEEAAARERARAIDWA